jgi:glycine/D-amino acid oxidase-like deaminating enzyme
MSERADVVIVGGAVMGSATAFFLRRLGHTGRIVVVERDPTYRDASTARSAGGVRQQFSTPENIRLSQFTLDLLADLSATFGGEAAVPFQENGYLILASGEGRDVLARNVETQCSLGADTVLLEGAALSGRFPWLVTDGVAAGAFGTRREGWIDPMLWMGLFRAGARDQGVTYLHDEVVSLAVAGGRIESVGLGSGGRIACGALVNAAGPWAGALARLAGIALPVEPRKRYIYVVDRREAPEALHRAPLTVDTSGIFFRPEGRRFITGISPEEAEEPPAVDLESIDHGFFESAVWPGLAARVPLFEEIKVVGAWAGYYDYNTLDQNAVIGPHPEVRNFYFCNGFSGHGLQQAAAAGRATAELITTGRFATIDLARFGYERIGLGAPLFEENVI